MFGSFLAIRENAEWPRFLAHPLCLLLVNFLLFKTRKDELTWKRIRISAEIF